jgi:hypothetical protein
MVNKISSVVFLGLAINRSTITMRNYTASNWSQGHYHAQARELLRLKSPITIVSSNVPEQEPPYYKSMEWKHVFITNEG